jgi:hypothetical protein
MTLPFIFEQYPQELVLPWRNTSNPPDFTGTETGGTAFAVTGTAISAQTLRPPGEPVGSVRFFGSATAGQSSQWATTSSNWFSSLSDGNYGIGFWIRFASVPTGTQTTRFKLFKLEPAAGNAIGFEITLSGSDNTANPSKFHFWGGSADSVPVAFGNAITAGPWYYVTVRKSGLNFEVFLNGDKKITVAGGGAGISGGVQLIFGSSQVLNGSINYSNYHHAPASVFTDEMIYDVWFEGEFNPLRINFEATAATATALLTDEVVTTTTSKEFQATPATGEALQRIPSIIITSPDYTKITASILVSALMPTAIGFGSRTVDFNAGVATASAQFEEHTIVTGTGVSFDAETSIGHTAEIINPERVGQDSTDYPAQPFTASATSGTHLVSFSPNYRHLVKRNDPVYYISRHVGRVTPVQDGRFAWPGHSPAATFLEPQPSPGTFVSINDGLSWTVMPSATQAGSKFAYSDSVSRSFINQLFGPSATMNFTVEHWRQSSPNDASNFGPDESPIFFSPGVTITSSEITVQPIEDVYNITYYQSVVDVTLNLSPNDIGLRYLIPPASRPAAETFYPDTKMHHIVFRIEQLQTGGITTAFFYNGTPINPTEGSGWFETPVSTTNSNITGWGPYASGAFGDKLEISANTGAGERFDEFAIYDKALSNSEIFDHFSFVDTIEPSRNIESNTFEAFAVNPNAVIFTVQNRNIPGDTLYSDSELVLPSILAETNITINAEVISGTQADAIDPFFFGDPDFTSRPVPATANAEVAPNILRINENYALYILEEFEPHRFVRFDAPDPNFDSGSDTKYGAAVPFVYNGEITLPINGINNNSLMSDGIDYTTSGLIVKESEWDDDWGTDSNSYHTSFWIKRDIFDTPSTTGIRVLMSVYGASNGAYGILYQYQDRLHFETFDGTNRNTSTTANIINVLDYNRHNIVIAFSHTGANNNAKLYVDGNLEMSLSLGTSQLVLTNSTTALEPNTETNNFPRAAVGALIAPYANTSLPLIPTATKMLIDEFYWSKMQITAAQVQDLYEAMPFKVNLNFNADFFLLQNAEIINPSIGTGAGIQAAALTATAEEIVQPTIDVDVELVFDAEIFESNAEGIEPFSVIGDDVRDIDFSVGESLMAYADMREAIVTITIPFPTMYASARAVNSTPYFDPYHLLIVQQSRLPLTTSFAGRWGIGDID